MTTTIERNYRKNPHTASWLMKFHAAAAGLPSDVDGENDYMTPAERDLLDEVPVEAPKADRRSAAQVALMDRLIAQITELDATVGGQARSWTDGMTAAGEWTFGRDPRTGISSWIDRMIAKVNALRAVDKLASAPVTVEVADGRYAVEEDGVLRFFKVKNGRRPGFVFLDIQASDEWHSIRNVARIRAVLALIAADAHAAMIRYGQEIGECGHCGRTLTDEASRAAGIGPICAAKY